MAQNSIADDSGESHLPVSRIAIIYCTSRKNNNARGIESLADTEMIEVARAVKGGLEEKGYQAEMIDLEPTQIADLQTYDWIFNLAETIYGYPLPEYKIARQLEKFHINFTGSSASTLRACLDKAITKRKLMKSGIRTPAFEVFPYNSMALTRLEYPLFVKPIREDGSVGISNDSIARDEAELSSQVKKVHHRYRQAALVEEYIEGRDIAASILGNGAQAMVLPLSETTYAEKCPSPFLTFTTKWVADSPDYMTSGSACPPNLEPDVNEQIQELALRAYRLMGCRDYARVDFRLRGKTPYVLEVNPNPCLNPDEGGFLRSCKAIGFSYADMVNAILESSIQYRYQRTHLSRKRNRYEPGIKKPDGPGPSADSSIVSSYRLIR